MNNMEMFLLVVVLVALVLPAGASGIDSRSNVDVPTILSWYPQVIDYVYVNDTMSEMIEYSITASKSLEWSNWTVNGAPAEGTVDGSIYSLTHIWDEGSERLNTVVFRGGGRGSQMEFKWYVNAYETEGDSGSVFDILDEALENHVTDIKILMFKYQISKGGDYGELTAMKVNMLNTEIARRQMTGEALRKELKAGNITVEEYVAGLKQAQRESKYDMKLAKELAKIVMMDLKDEKLGRELENLSIIEEDWGEKTNKDYKKENKSKGKKN